MKKFVIALVLFFATGTSISMEREIQETNLDVEKEIKGILSINKQKRSRSCLSLVNNLSIENRLWDIECSIMDKDGTNRSIIITQNQRIQLGTIASIAKICTSIHDHTIIGKIKVGVSDRLMHTVDKYKKWDDLTSQLLEKIKDNENDDHYIVVTWKDPNAPLSYNWNYEFINQTKNILSLANNLSVDQNRYWNIECSITNNNGNKKSIIIKQGKCILLGEIASIAEMRISTDKSIYSSIGTAHPIVYTVDKLKKWDDLTAQLSDEIKNHENDNLRIVITWQNPDDTFSFEWNHLFALDKASSY